MALSLSPHDSLCRSPQHRDRTRTPRDALCQSNLTPLSVRVAGTRARKGLRLRSVLVMPQPHASIVTLSYTEQRPELDRELYSANTRAAQEARAPPLDSTAQHQSTTSPHARQPPREPPSAREHDGATYLTGFCIRNAHSKCTDRSTACAAAWTARLTHTPHTFPSCPF